jgi:hypothetical protein
MYKLLFGLIFILTACQSFNHDRDFLKPIDANKYENEVKYLCDGELKASVGQGACQYPEGEMTRFHVKVPPTYGTVSASSCQGKETIDFTKKNGEVILDWSFPDTTHSCPIIISVAGYDSGVQLFRFIPYVYNDRYPELEQQVTKQLPTHGVLSLMVKIDPELAGKILVSTTCDLMYPKQKITEFEAGTEGIRIKVKATEQKFCPVAYAVKYENNDFTEGEIYINFYNNKYIPLPNPRVGKKGKLCPPHGARYFEVDGDKRSRCRKGDSAYSWTRIGRMSIYGN